MQDIPKADNVFLYLTEARQLLLQLATEGAADDRQKETLVSALRALDSALRVSFRNFEI